MRVAHLTTVDLSLRYLVFPQLLAVIDAGGEAVGVSSPGPWVEELEKAGIEHIALTASTRGMSLKDDLRAAWQFWRVVRDGDFTVLHTHNPKPGVYGRILGRLAGVPLVVNTVHGLYAQPDDRFLKRAVVYSLEAIAARFSDIELSQNPEDLEFCTRTRIFPKGKGALLGNGVDLRRFDPHGVDPEARARLRAELDVGDDDILVGAVGRLVAEKGLPELFEAMERLGEGHVLAAIGPNDPDKADALPQELIERAGRHGVRFLGMRSDMPELYSAMDVFVLPSHREGFPRAAMEATAMGLPLVVTDIRGCRQVVDHGVNGFLAPVRDPVALANSIAKLGESSGLRSDMGKESFRISRERFDEEQVVRIVMQAYQDGLESKGLGHLLPAGMVTTSEYRTRPARADDAAAVADLHARGITGGFLPRLGPRFLKVLYRALIAWPGAEVRVAEDGESVVAFAAGVTDTGVFYDHFVKRHGVAAVLAALPRLLRPSNARRAWETFRYGGRDDGPRAELLSMAVTPRARGNGLSVRLGEEVLDGLSGQGADRVRVVVGADNDAALAAYPRLGFADHATAEVHAGEHSNVLVWRAS